MGRSGKKPLSTSTSSLKKKSEDEQLPSSSEVDVEDRRGRPKRSGPNNDEEAPPKKAVAATKRNRKMDKSEVANSKESEGQSSAQEVSPYFGNLGAGLKLSREFFDQDCLELSKALLGSVLCRRIPTTGEVLKGTIVETEAYPGGDDRASQSYNGKRTPRNEAMYMDPGTAYVYFTYGMYYCFNITSRGEGSACLIRAVEPLEDYATMHELRCSRTKKKDEDTDQVPAKKRFATHELANGPSKLCIALSIDRDTCNKIDMCVSEELWLEHHEDTLYRNRGFEIVADKRIGIDSTPPEARNKLWRFYVKDSWSESRAKIGELKKKAKLQETSTT